MRTLLCIGWLALAAGASAQDSGMVLLERVTVQGLQPSSLPTTLPTTVEGLGAQQLARDINATDSADALKYLPSLLVRKRYVGDYDHAVLSTRASGTGNSARSLVYADGILLSNLLGNGASFTPRWGLVSPEEIERVDVLYGPFSAAYAGNSVGAVVDYVTRMPKTFEAHGRLLAAQQHFRYHGSDSRPASQQGSLNLGQRWGDWSAWLSLNRLASQSHPLVFVTRTPATTPAAGSATPVSGAVSELNRFNQPWWLIGATHRADTAQDSAKLKLGWNLAPGLRATALLAQWENRVQREPDAWLRDASGAPVELRPDNWQPSRAVSIDGRAYSLSAADFGRSRERLTHRVQGLTLRETDGGWLDWQLSASRYEYAQDQVRAWAPLPGQAQAGRLTDQAGTGWTQLAARVSTQQGAHRFEGGLQHDGAALRNRVSNTREWTAGEASGSPTSRFEGRSQLTSAWAQHSWRFAEDWHSVLGLRFERWQADQGLTANG